jgi:glycosyltransferase involved in cell wall biosynthesis
LLEAKRERPEIETLAIIAACDEEISIGTMVLEAKAHVDEVVVVDDGSKDRTAAVAAAAGARVLRHDSNRGKGMAVRTALEYARANGVQAVVLLDADGQHDPDDIPRLLEPVLAGRTDLAIGLRFRENTKMPFYRRIGKRTLDYATAASGGGPVTDSQSGFRALSRTAIESMTLTEDGFGIESEMLVEANEKSLRVSEVPVSVRYDVGEHSKRPFVHGFGVVDRLLNIVAVRHPLLFFGGSGLILFVAGFGLGLETLNVYNATRNFVIGYALLVVAFLLLGALSMFAGVILNVLPKVLSRGLNGRNGQPRN